MYYVLGRMGSGFGVYPNCFISVAFTKSVGSIATRNERSMWFICNETAAGAALMFIGLGGSVACAASF